MTPCCLFERKEIPRLPEIHHIMPMSEERISKKEGGFGNNLRNLRKARGLSQPELARQLGITKQAVSNWENNRIIPSASMLRRLSQILAVSMETILGEEVKYVSVEGLTSEQIVHIQFLINDMRK